MARGMVLAEPARTIDEVLVRLDEIVDWSKQKRSRHGYFAALYRQVTRKAKERIEARAYDDGERMERLDVVFANRYLDAFQRYRRGQTTTKCWQVAFDAAASPVPIVLQHLLLGINAHINLDLGIAAALVAPGDNLPALRRDFDLVNDILFAMVDDVQDRLNQVWPLMKLCDIAGCRTDEAIFNFSLGKARASAWAVAERLIGLGETEMAYEIARIDARTASLAKLVRYPGFTPRLALLVVRVMELRGVPRIIDILS